MEEILTVDHRPWTACREQAKRVERSTVDRRPERSLDRRPWTVDRRPWTVDHLRSDRGSALVEFAVTGLLFFALVFGIMEASRAIYHYNIIASVAREGTRFAAVRGSESGRPASVADIQDFVRGRALGINPTVIVNWSPANNPGGIIQVEVQHTFTTIMPLAGVPNMTMSSTARGIVVR
jgi:hypothetical protein